jgi:hypothetical protein
MRTKLEMLFNAVRGFGKTYTASMLVWLPVMKGKVSYDKGKDMHMEVMKDYRTLINGVVGGSITSMFGLPIPPFAVIDVPRELISGRTFPENS